jgi:demethoxyubiquinone hydroxylase (CLK1/Coq7/Cat5 family)
MLEVRESGSKTVDALNSLLRGEISAVETYRMALEKLIHTAARTTIEDCLHSHEARVNVLTQEVTRFGGEPSRTSGPWGSFAKLVEGGAKALGEKAAIAALEEGEDHGLKQYRSEMGKVDGSARHLLETQLLPAQQRTHRAMSDLKHTIH